MCSFLFKKNSYNICFDKYNNRDPFKYHLTILTKIRDLTRLLILPILFYILYNNVLVRSLF